MLGKMLALDLQLYNRGSAFNVQIEAQQHKSTQWGCPFEIYVSGSFGQGTSLSCQDFVTDHVRLGVPHEQGWEKLGNSVYRHSSEQVRATDAKIAVAC
jgi:hypothetical protein